MCQTRQMRPIVVAALLTLATTAGCADAVRDARRADAFDVAGRYASADGELEIANEADKNDVRLTLTRDAATASEEPFAARLIAGDPRKLELGRGRDSLRTEIDGGENVSFDGGHTSTIQVTGLDVPATPTRPDATDARLRWSVLLVANEEGALAGALRLSSIERRPRAGEVDGFSTESEHIDVDVAFVRVD